LVVAAGLGVAVNSPTTTTTMPRLLHPLPSLPTLARSAAVTTVTRHAVFTPHRGHAPCHGDGELGTIATVAPARPACPRTAVAERRSTRAITPVPLATLVPVVPLVRVTLPLALR
jgi:hypothetical protein